MIKVYDATERLFNNNGIKVIRPLFAEITKIDNSDYYIELEDILDNSEYYQKGLIVRVPTPWGEQGFRCDNPIIQNNRISCKAWHLSYDSENYVINSATVTDKKCDNVIKHYNGKTDTTSPFTVFSDIEADEEITTVMERVTLFDVFTALINNYGGHWYRDNFTFGIKSRVGEDRGVVLAYNKNITDIKVEENWDNVCTKLLPYVVDGETTITLDQGYVELEEQIYTIPFTKALKFECDKKKDDYTTEDEYVADVKEWLYDEAVKYLEANRLPLINCSVSANLDNVSDVGDTILVKHQKCGDDKIPTNVISVKYDAIRGRYTAIEFGNFKKVIKNLTQEVASVAQTESKKTVNETVPDWSKSPTKPSYTKNEVGLGNVDNIRQYSSDNPPPYPVKSVNGQTGKITLSATDVGADELLSAHDTDSNAHAGILLTKVDKNGISLGLHTDGLIYVFVDGQPAGNGIAFQRD